MNTETEFDIESLPVTITYVCQTKRDNNWDCDQWRVTLQSKAGSWSTDYFTGLGHRSKPVKPKIADVLYSLFLDASAADENFNDWCANLGYSDDSISAFNTYKQCLDTATQLRKHFNPEQRASIQSVIQDM